MVITYRTFSLLCGSLIYLSPIVIEVSLAPTVLVTNGKMQIDILTLQGSYSEKIRAGSIILLLVQRW